MDLYLCQNIRCEFGATCTASADRLPRCTCLFDCGDPERGSEVCGSDLRLYSSECVLRREACERQQQLNPRPLVLCQGLNSGSPWMLVSISVSLMVACVHDKA